MSRLFEGVRGISEGSREERWELDYAGRPAAPEGERSDAVRNRRRILRVARRLFAERGVTRVSMSEIARVAGVGKGTLYRRFPNKGALCHALLDEPTREFQREALAEVSGGGGPVERLRRFLDRLVWFMEEHLDLFYGGHEALSGPGRLEQMSSPAYEWRRAVVLALLRAAQREGEIPGDLDVEYLAIALLAPLDVDLYYHQRRVRGIPPERISAGLRALVPALSAPPEGG
ncbi:TetR/AcrR family transcriptional regulator [Rubrobacter taiwanensis]|uniref:TetR/AcrR family transcriptional regulator n=1 Tax=Rubrobacter taiwanensis TaxID=185139 RepID=A0A4R1BLZ5_9ACTN|nr:TetR/AcrR family transcriptional regulator [Rubrobacter taiwanensis]